MNKQIQFYCIDCGNPFRDYSDNKYVYCEQCGCEHIREEFKNEKM